LKARSLTCDVWRDIRRWLDLAYPAAVIIPEGREPRTGRPLAFDADFFLVINAEHASLFDNHAAGILPFQPPRHPFFDAAGLGSTQVFLEGWDAVKTADPSRLVIVSSADHDFDRLRCGTRTMEQLGAALTFLFTWGSVPCLYYGDEIGMRYLPGMPDVEGAVCNPAYDRAGCRTPMQWDGSLNAGFSTAQPSRLYLPIDPDPARPNVADQENQQDATLNLVRRLIGLRKSTPALGSRAATRVLHDGYPFTFTRGETHLVVVNPRQEPAVVSAPEIVGARDVLSCGVTISNDQLTIEGFGYGVLARA